MENVPPPNQPSGPAPAVSSVASANANNHGSSSSSFGKALENLSHDLRSIVRDQPWLANLPVMVTLQAMFNGMAEAPNLKHFQMLHIAKEIFELMVKEHKHYLVIYPGNKRTSDFLEPLENIFDRLVSYKEFKNNRNSETEEFIDSMWTEYQKENGVKLSTNILINLMTAYPDKIDPILETSMLTDNYRLITPFCGTNRPNFMTVMKKLYYNYCNGNQREALEYSQGLVKHVMSNCPEECSGVNLFPTRFISFASYAYALMYEFDPDLQTWDNLAVTTECLEKYLTYIENLYKDVMQVHGDWPFAYFIICSFSITKELLRYCNSAKILDFNRFPNFWTYYNVRLRN